MLGTWMLALGLKVAVIKAIELKNAMAKSPLKLPLQIMATPARLASLYKN